MNNIGLLLVACLFLFSCAGLEIEKAETSSKGIRYYESSPFLLVYTDNKGGLTSKIIYLPDSTKLMSVRPVSILAKNDATLKFDKGLMTQTKAVVDETAIPSQVISSLGTVATSLIKAANASDGNKTYEVPPPYLFRIVISESNGAFSLAGKASPTKIRVTKAKAEDSDDD